MSGKIGELIDRLIESRAKGNPAIAEMTKAKLILKGVYVEKDERYCSDEPEIIERLIEIKEQWSYEEPYAGGSSLKTAYSEKKTEGEVVLDILSQLSDSAIKVIIFFASPDYNQERLSRLMGKAFAGRVVFGCSTTGERFKDKLLTNSVVVLALTSKLIADAKVEVIEDVSKACDPRQAFKSFSRYFNESTQKMDTDRYVGIVLIDGLSLKEEQLIDRIGNLTNISFVGGSAGDNFRFVRTTVYANGKSYSDAAVIALLKMQPKAGVSIISTQSFQARDAVLVANKVNVEAREVIEFNHQPAAQAYAEALGIAVDDIEEHFFNHPVGLVLDENNILIRSPLRKIDTKMKFSSNILENMEVRLLEDGDIVRETQKVIEEKKQALGKRLAGIMSFDCIYRRLELEQKQLVAEYGEIFKDIPTAGCYVYGEFNVGFINHTLTMLVFECEDYEQNEAEDEELYIKGNQQLIQINRALEREVADLKHKLEGAIQELKVFNTLLAKEMNERTKREEDIKYLSYHDALTGLYNRRFYDEAINKLSDDNHLPITIIVGDVDNLKMINDTLGHAKGDELLQKSALILKESCRSDDIIIRLGGDEFVIFLHQTTQEVVAKIVKRIGENASRHFVEGHPISISLGWATTEHRDESITEVFTNAENSMYKRKNTQRG